ncbi:MazG-like family protein [Serpentinicella sp. ANB-PHB4]|uniref:MazG-like family protein n=1 Tax=Serpentinicella sp. ANB-PHB4 TaxID=3074076 RepID=UPI00285B5FF4|nr:MazG-like family protein [Serpentinicella sp. ANB-PHB4]MDR5658882.1 MazG-like family protein [Serpentinicella sp. ANB-PHB4]
MFTKRENVDVGKNLKMIEFLKCELLNSFALLFQTILKGAKEGQDLILECLANIILVTYSLGRRLGINYDVIDKKVQDKAKIYILEDHQLEEWYQDLSGLSKHIKGNRK